MQDDGEVRLFYSDAAADTFRALNMQPPEKLCCSACGFSSRFSRVGSDEFGGSWVVRVGESVRVTSLEHVERLNGV